MTEVIEANESSTDPGFIDRVMAHSWADHHRGKTPSQKPRDPIEADAIDNLGFDFVERLGWPKTGDGQYARPGTDKAVSASVVTAEDGTPLFHVFTSNAPPLEKGGNYNAFRLYTLLVHNGDKVALSRSRYR
jgi:hypothetical protein